MRVLKILGLRLVDLILFVGMAVIAVAVGSAPLIGSSCTSPGWIAQSARETPGTVFGENMFCSWPSREEVMGRGILLWMLGVPIPIIILLALIWH